VELISDITSRRTSSRSTPHPGGVGGRGGPGLLGGRGGSAAPRERSGEATKQIGAIVKTIQADTQDAVAAMEKSTQGVVEGAKLSDAAGQALTEIDS